MKANELYESNKIDKWLDRVVNGTWLRNADGTIDVNGNVKLPKETKEIPVQFGYVSGYFNCHSTNIISLEGSPKNVGGHFGCSFTNITSLEGSPNYVGNLFNCSETNITSLEGAPQEVGANFDCSFTNILSLKGIAKYIGNNLVCSKIKIIDPYEYRYALFSIIDDEFISTSQEIDEIINEYGYDGSPKSKRRVTQGLKLLKALPNKTITN